MVDKDEVNMQLLAISVVHDPSPSAVLTLKESAQSDSSPRYKPCPEPDAMRLET